MTEPIFKPGVSIFFDADPIYHGPNNKKFKVSYGTENNKSNVLLLKVQMFDVHLNRIQGRQAPSYTINDFNNLQKAKKQLDAYLSLPDSVWNSKTKTWNGGNVVLKLT